MKIFSTVAKVGIAVVFVAVIIVLVLVFLGKPVPKWILLVFFAGAVICFVSSLINKKRDR